TQSFQGSGGLPPTASAATPNTTTSSLFGALADPTPTTGTTTNQVGIDPVVLTYPRIVFDPEGSADDAFIDFQAGQDKVRVVVEAASGRTRILNDREYEAALRGD